jgi:hypothetical protein
MKTEKRTKDKLWETTVGKGSRERIIGVENLE